MGNKLERRAAVVIKLSREQLHQEIWCDKVAGYALRGEMWG